VSTIEQQTQRTSLGKDIAQRFEPLSDQANERVTSAYATLARNLVDVLPEGREKSVAITHLEESMFWATAASVRSG
jgi:hypothetical protein